MFETGSDVVVCDASGVKRFWVTERGSPPSNGEELEGSQCVSNEAQGTRLTFSRPLQAQANGKANAANRRLRGTVALEERLVSIAQPNIFTWARGTAAGLSYHGINKGVCAFEF